MMYQTGLVAVIKVNGKVLRENKDVVLLPFGAEYSILIKNLKSQRVQVKVSIDGTDATENTRLVIPANSEIELERFIKNGNWAQGNRFKFIERTEQIEDHRGIKADDGIVRIEYWTEDVNAYIPVPVTYTYPNWKPNGYYSSGYNYNGLSKSRSFDSFDSGGAMRSCNTVNYSGSISGSSVQSFAGSTPTANFAAQSLPANDAGITVPGSLSNQQFTYTSGFPVLAQSEVLILNLRGQVAGKTVSQPVLVSTKVTCQTCGKRSTANTPFCSACGTSLNIV